MNDFHCVFLLFVLIVSAEFRPQFRGFGTRGEPAENQRMINTYNETGLHRAIKEALAAEVGGRTEAVIPGTRLVADVMDGDGNVVEVQTGSVGALSEKARLVLSRGRSFRVVRPVVVEKTLVSPDGTRRKSPRQDTVYSILRGIGRMADILGEIRLDALFVTAEEIRRAAEGGEAGKRRRRPARHVVAARTLVDASGSRSFRSAADWLSLLPPLPEPFTIPQVRAAIGSEGFGGLGPEDARFNARSRESAAAQAGMLMWLLERLGLCRRDGKRGNANLWRTT